MLSVAIKAMKAALAEMAAGGHPADARRLPFEELYAEVGLREYYLPPTPYSLLPTTYYLLPTTYYLLSITDC